MSAKLQGCRQKRWKAGTVRGWAPRGRCDNPLGARIGVRSALAHRTPILVLRSIRDVKTAVLDRLMSTRPFWPSGRDGVPAVFGERCPCRPFPFMADRNNNSPNSISQSPLPLVSSSSTALVLAGGEACATLSGVHAGFTLSILWVSAMKNLGVWVVCLSMCFHGNNLSKETPGVLIRNLLEVLVAA